MGINAFIDNGYAPGKEFCEKLLSSSEFTVETLKLIWKESERLKNELAVCIANALEQDKLTSNKVLLEYVKQPRTWLSLKLGKHLCVPELKHSESLLNEFGEDGWYGPIKEPSGSEKIWYIRTYKIVDHISRGIGFGSQLDKRYIRWSVIAEVGKDYVALSWDGFTYNSIVEASIEQRIQFPFWHHIPIFFDELSKHCQAEWEYPNLHNLVLHDMWDKYLNKSINNIFYKWKHLRIRAEASGLAINAHSSGIQEIDARGLQALSQQLAHSVLNTLGFSGDPEKINNAEDAILLTLIKEWGTKSYEFELCSESKINDVEAVKIEYLIKAHCYFGLKPNSSTQDSVLHLKCHSGYYGGSTSVLEFLLRELR